MDTSEIYIKMCDIPEIQEQWTIPPFPQDFCYRQQGKCIVAGINVRAKFIDDYIWLPRQDQIQKIMGYIPRDGTYRLLQFIDDDVAKFNSWEQLWLAFYMWEQRNKVWDGDKWVKSG